MREIQSNPVCLVLGAGFSKCAGVPCQSEFSSRLLSPHFGSEIDQAITRTLSGFLKDVFGWKDGDPWPTLEDIFTCIDLSANTGHHLGIKYTPKLLRAIRRMAIYRVFSVLDDEFNYSSDIVELLCHFLSEGQELAGAIVLNWDIVPEKHLAQLSVSPTVDYCCEATDWRNPERALPYQVPGRRTVRVCKMHGSSNWVYCENCCALYYDLEHKLSLRSKVGLIKHDFRLFDEKFTGTTFNRHLGIAPQERKCPRCKNMVSSHIATFSYRKSFRTFAFSEIWHRAAEILAAAGHWVFIGYSLPSADFELKHLLKSAQLRFAHIPNSEKSIDVVSRGEAARAPYEALFGKAGLDYFGGGLAAYVAHLAGKSPV